jgi:hypothetical protein
MGTLAALPSGWLLRPTASFTITKQAGPKKCAHGAQESGT